MVIKKWSWNDNWGKWGKESPCKHLLKLRSYLEENEIHITSEHGIEPMGWVNVSCPCRTYEVVLRDKDEEEEEEEW